MTSKNPLLYEVRSRELTYLDVRGGPWLTDFMRELKDRSFVDLKDGKFVLRFEGMLSGTGDLVVVFTGTPDHIGVRPSGVEVMTFSFAHPRMAVCRRTSDPMEPFGAGSLHVWGRGNFDLRENFDFSVQVAP